MVLYSFFLRSLELYKFDLYSQFLSHPSLFDLNQEYLGEKEQYSYLQHINHYVDSIFMNDHYVLFMPKLGIYCSILDRIIQCPYLYENNETLLYLLINPIFSNIDVCIPTCFYIIELFCEEYSHPFYYHSRFDLLVEVSQRRDG